MSRVCRDCRDLHSRHGVYCEECRESRLTKTCHRCRLPFQCRDTYEAKSRQFCSRRCAATKVAKSCVQCGIDSTQYDFVWCSGECSQKYIQERAYPVESYYLISGLGGHPLAREGQVGVHRLVLWQKLECTSIECSHSCEQCEESLSWRSPRYSGIVSDHIDRDPSNSNPENLRVLCHSCNWNRDNPNHQLVTRNRER